MFLLNFFFLNQYQAISILKPTTFLVDFSFFKISSSRFHRKLLSSGIYLHTFVRILDWIFIARNFLSRSKPDRNLIFSPQKTFLGQDNLSFHGHLAKHLSVCDRKNIDYFTHKPHKYFNSMLSDSDNVGTRTAFSLSINYD